MFGQLSLTPVDAKPPLVQNERSLLKQSNAVKKRRQAHGWGIGYYPDSNRSPVIVKSRHAAFDEKAGFRLCAEQAHSRIIIAHIRNASNPKKLPLKKILGRSHSQPFSAGNVLFSHNGMLSIPDEIRRRLGKYGKFVRGLNDSEVYFWQLMKHIDACGDIPAAIQACMDEDWTVWKSCRARYPDKKVPYIGLNALVSDGKCLHAFCHYPLPRDPGALCSKGWPWGRIAYTLSKDKLIFASEPLDRRRNSWRSFSDLQIASAELKKGNISLKFRKLSVPGVIK